jgi:predicted enzyme related to lactoylglutathione lyase
MRETDQSVTRRDAFVLAAVSLSALPMIGCQGDEDGAPSGSRDSANATASEKRNDTRNGESMRIHYLEIVTKDVDATCKLYSGVHGVTFGDADQSLGGARTAQLADGGMLGIRAPMHEGENSVTRAYMLVEDIEAAVAAAKDSGAEIAVPPMQLPGHGTCAIYVRGGVEAGLWQL